MDESPRNQAGKNDVPPARARGRLQALGAAVLMLGLVAALMFGRQMWSGRQGAQPNRIREADAPRVLVTRVTLAPETREISLPATVHGYVETPIYAKVAGYLKEIFVDKGSIVYKGQVLAVIESPELDHQVANARADYNLKAITDRRNQALLRSGVITHQLADQSHANMLQAKAVLGQLLAMQSYEVIKAPFSGMITARYVDPGTLIPESTTPTSGTTPVVMLATLNPLRIYAQVPQRSAAFIKDGDRATVTVAEYPGRQFKGPVTRHPRALDAATRTMLVEVDMENPGLALMPGMYATAEFRLSTPAGAPMVPDDSLVFRNGKVYVPVVRNRRIRLVEVTLGYDDGHRAEALRGIRDDDVVAVNLGQSARDGEPVEPVFAQAASE